MQIVAVESDDGEAQACTGFREGSEQLHRTMREDVKVSSEEKALEPTEKGGVGSWRKG